MRHVLLAALLTGCAPDVLVTLPAGSLEGMESVIYAVEGPDGSFEVATGRVGLPIEVELDGEDTAVRVLTYAGDITRAFAEVGPLTDIAPDGRSIPDPDGAWRWDGAAWSPSAEPSGALTAFRARAPDACGVLVYSAEAVDFGGATVEHAHNCDAPCALELFLSNGEVLVFDRDAPTQVGLRFDVMLDGRERGDLLHALVTNLGTYLGHERGFDLLGANGTTWYPGPWSDVAREFLFPLTNTGWLALAVTAGGEVQRYQGTSWSLQAELGPSDARPFIAFTVPDQVEVYRGDRWTTIVDGTPTTRTLPTDGIIHSTRYTRFDGTITRVIGTSVGEVLMQTGPATWTSVGATGTRAPVVGADYWRDAWFVFDADGRVIQRRSDGTICESVDVLDEEAQGMLVTEVGYYIWGASSVAFINGIETI
ncbi:MAG: hypothetical protein RMA76_08970 [Deltaproteobacteria bacterium]|jgi:hypothetical protein